MTTHGEGPAGVPREHRIKLWSEFAGHIMEGSKTYEVRKDDREYEVGDLLVMVEVDRETEAPTGWELRAWVIHKTPGGRFGIAPDYCVLGIEFIRADRAPAPGIPVLGVGV